jgi:hypothetical protein
MSTTRIGWLPVASDETGDGALKPAKWLCRWIAINFSTLFQARNLLLQSHLLST